MNIAKPVTFAASLTALALVMAFGEPGADPCSADFGMEKSAEIVEQQLGVVDIAWTDVQQSGCRLQTQGFADVMTAGGFGRRHFEVVVAFDDQSRRWQQVSFQMP